MADTRDTIRERMLNNLDSKFDKLPGTFTWETYQAEGIELESKYVELEDSLNQRFAGTADLENLKVIAFEKGIIWKDSVKASGVVKVTGNVGSKVSIGDLFSSQLNEYSATEEKILDNTGIAYVKIECTVGGIIGNTPANTIISFPKSLMGINTVTNEVALTNGYEAETREELLKRYYTEIQKPATSGNVNHYEKWALSVEGVGGVKVKPTWNGGGTVKVVIIDRNKAVANQQLITDTYTYIETQRPIGANITVVSATEFLINVNCKITLKQNYTLDQAKADIQKNIEQYFKDTTFLDNNIYYAKIGNLIFNSIGVNNIDYTAFTINNAKNDIILIDSNSETQIPKLSTLDITV